MIDDMDAFGYGVSALVVAVPALIGVAAVIAGILRWRRVRRLADTGERVTAVVVDNQQESLREGRIAFLPVVRFHTRTGREVRAVLDDMRSPRSYLAETSFEVVYDPVNPERVAMAGNRTGGGVVAIVTGFVFLGFAVVAYTLVRSMVAGF